jgi:7-cyano-7-deazaguanine synthase
MSSDRPSPARHAVIVAPGGLESTTLAYWLRAIGTQRLTLLGVDYGQSHHVELSYAKRRAAALEAWYVQLNLPGLGGLHIGSDATDRQVEVPHGYYPDSSMRVLAVPNRNALLLDLAVGFALSARADAVAFAGHIGDHPVYPDCGTEFIDAYTRMVALGNEGSLGDGFQILAPFTDKTKADIVRLGAELKVPFADTWSCYSDHRRHCGHCVTCVNRKEAFDVAGMPDPTNYDDSRGDRATSRGAPCT